MLSEFARGNLVLEHLVNLGGGPLFDLGQAEITDYARDGTRDSEADKRKDLVSELGVISWSI